MPDKWLSAAHYCFRPWLAGSVALILIVGLFVGGAQPGATSSIKEPWDKLLHALYFFTLTILLWRAMRHRSGLAAGCSLLVGALDELHQGMVPGRTMGLDDWIADLAGALLAVLAIRALQRTLSGALSTSAEKSPRRAGS